MNCASGSSAEETTPPTETLRAYEKKNDCNQNAADGADKDLVVPVKLKIEDYIQFLSALRAKDFQLAKRLCQMILVYDPHHPEASEFLPLIQRKLLKEKCTNQNSEDNECNDDDDSGSDEESSQNSQSLSLPSDVDAGSDQESKIN
ncbi:glutamate-rich protein 2 [Stigmatopora nigra]